MKWPGVIAVMALVVVLLGLANNTMNETSNWVTPSTNNVHGASVITGARMYTNQSGVYLEVAVAFNRTMYVEGVIVTTDTWLAESQTLDPNWVMRLYGDRMIPIEKEYAAGTHTIVVKLTDKVTPPVPHKVASEYDLFYISYPVWRGKVVIGDDEIPLSKFGEVRDIEPRVLDVTAVIIPKFIYAYHISHPVILRTNINFTMYEEKLKTMILSDASPEDFKRFATTLAREIIESVKNGSTVIGYYDIGPIETEVARKLIEEGRIWLELYISVSKTVAYKEVVRNDIPGGFKYMLANITEIHVEVSTKTNRTSVSVREETVLTSRPVLVPGMKDVAVILVYRKNPYALYRVAVVKVRNVNLYPISG